MTKHSFTTREEAYAAKLRMEIDVQMVNRHGFKLGAKGTRAIVALKKSGMKEDQISSLLKGCFQIGDNAQEALEALHDALVRRVIA